MVVVAVVLIVSAVVVAVGWVSKGGWGNIRGGCGAVVSIAAWPVVVVVAGLSLGFPLVDGVTSDRLVGASISWVALVNVVTIAGVRSWVIVVSVAAVGVVGASAVVVASIGLGISFPHVAVVASSSLVAVLVRASMSRMALVHVVTERVRCWDNCNWVMATVAGVVARVVAGVVASIGLGFPLVEVMAAMAGWISVDSSSDVRRTSVWMVSYSSQWPVVVGVMAWFGFSRGQSQNGGNGTEDLHC